MGQIIWYAPRKTYGDGGLIIAPRVVIKVGRKWADFAPEGQRHATGRVDMTTMKVDGGDNEEIRMTPDD